MKTSTSIGRPRIDLPPLFHVPFCSNPNCLYFHHPPDCSTAWCVHHGFYDTKIRGPVPRARCLRCGKTFSRQTYRVSYYMKISIDLIRMYLEIIGGASLRAVSRAHGCTIGSVINRVNRLSRQAITMHQRLLSPLSLEEDLCADGFISFTVSQYFPDSTTIICGVHSQMIYGLNHCILRRRGRMRPDQLHRRETLETLWKAEAHGEQHALTTALFETLSTVWKSSQHLTLFTDEHLEYPPAIDALAKVLPDVLSPAAFTHERINSRIAHASRGGPLFSANYIDRQLRCNLAAHRRETICFSRNESSSLARTVLYMIYHNYNKAHRIVDTRYQPPAHAVQAGIREDLVAHWWDLFFEKRVIYMKAQPEGFLRTVWLRGIETPLKKRAEYLPAYAFAS